MQMPGTKHHRSRIVSLCAAGFTKTVDASVMKGRNCIAICGTNMAAGDTAAQCISGKVDILGGVALACDKIISSNKVEVSCIQSAWNQDKGRCPPLVSSANDCWLSRLSCQAPGSCILPHLHLGAVHSSDLAHCVPAHL